MELVPATRTVRRTVRMAVALVVGQALLCALIGYLTLGRSGAHPRDDQMAEPPFAPPATATSSYASPTAAPRSMSAMSTRKPRSRAKADATPSRTRSSSSPPAPTAEPPPETLLAPGPVTTAPTSAPASKQPLFPPRPPSVSPSKSVQEPVTVGDLCAPEGAFGRTSDDTLVRCSRMRRHLPRWKIV